MSSSQDSVAPEALSRRDAVRRIASAVVGAGVAHAMPAMIGAQVHEAVNGDRTLQGEYAVRFFNKHEFRTLERLSELIIPADEGGPSGRAGGAPEFIDYLCSQNETLADIFTGGVLWIDHVARDRGGYAFEECEESAQTALLDGLVEAERTEAGGETRWNTHEYRRFGVFGATSPADLGQGLEFFQWARRLIMDAYYTSPAGIEDLGFQGNASHSEYQVPVEAISYAFGRSDLSDG